MAVSKTKVTLTLDTELVKRVDEIASAKRQSRSAWIEASMRESIDQDEAAVKFFSDPMLSGAFLKAFSEPGMLKQFAQTIGSDLEPDQLKLFGERVSGLVPEPQPVKDTKAGKKKRKR